ncbi:hypothetical protein LT493_12850 [Streptomyces tricolor]|nr:hypothetical protein [Streptomyces tricolor]
MAATSATAARALGHRHARRLTESLTEFPRLHVSRMTKRHARQAERDILEWQCTLLDGRPSGLALIHTSRGVLWYRLTAEGPDVEPLAPDSAVWQALPASPAEVELLLTPQNSPRTPLISTGATRTVAAGLPGSHPSCLGQIGASPSISPHNPARAASSRTRRPSGVPPGPPQETHTHDHRHTRRPVPSTSSGGRTPSGSPTSRPSCPPGSHGHPDRRGRGGGPEANPSTWLPDPSWEAIARATPRPEALAVQLPSDFRTTLRAS